MRTIEYTSKFKADYKRVLKGQLAKVFPPEFTAVVNDLAQDKPLPANKKDHQLKGKLKDCRDCHVLNDLVLIYRLVGDDVLQLVRLGSHSELGIA